MLEHLCFSHISWRYRKWTLAWNWFKSKLTLLFDNSSDKYVDNKAEGWISKQEFQENKARQIFRKTNTF